MTRLPETLLSSKEEVTLIASMAVTLFNPKQPNAHEQAVHDAYLILTESMKAITFKMRVMREETERITNDELKAAMEDPANAHY